MGRLVAGFLGARFSTWHHFVLVVSRPIALLSFSILGGCAHSGLPLAYVDPGPYGWSAAPTHAPQTHAVPTEALMRAAPPRRGGSAERSAPVLAPAPRERARPTFASGAEIPGGADCLAHLTEWGVPHELLDARPGVETPIAVEVPLGGVEYHTWGDSPLVCDCRLAVALVELGPELQRAGVTRVRYSGAYVYRTTRSGKRLSLHAHGLAIDIHEMTVRGEKLSVKHDFARGHSSSSECAELPAVNQVACRAGARGLFKELLTPDSDADHHDHLHFAVAPLGS